MHLKVNVAQPYTGVAPNLTMRFGQSGMWVVHADRKWSRIEPTINLRIAGERVIKPDGVTGAQSGDANLDPLTGGAWMPNNFGFNAYIGNGGTPLDISGEPANVRPIVIVEVLTNQEF